MVSICRFFIPVAMTLGVIVGCSGNAELPRAHSEELAVHCDSLFPYTYSHGVDELHSLMVLKGGKVLYERWAPGHGPEELHIQWSASKTYTATAIGFAAQDGLLTVEDPVVSFFSEDELPENPDERLSKVLVKHLLAMSSGFRNINLNLAMRSEKEIEPVKEALASEIINEPGTVFLYNATDSFLLSAIITKLTGLSLEDYLAKKLFNPIGIKHWYCDKDASGYNPGAYGLFLSTESMAKMGQFMLQRGQWKGRQLLNREWFDAAMSPQIMSGPYHPDDDWAQGYGYQMWCCTHGAYRLDGAWGQFVVIIHDKDAVVVCTAHAGDNGHLLRGVWKYVLPAL